MSTNLNVEMYMYVCIMVVLYYRVGLYQQSLVGLVSQKQILCFENSSVQINLYLLLFKNCQLSGSKVCWSHTAVVTRVSTRYICR